jgi:hypothetical protein
MALLGCTPIRVSHVCTDSPFLRLNLESSDSARWVLAHIRDDLVTRQGVGHLENATTAAPIGRGRALRIPKPPRFANPIREASLERQRLFGCLHQISQPRTHDL